MILQLWMHAAGADPGINYEGQVGGGGAREYEYNYEGQTGVHKRITLCSKVHVPPVPPSGSATVQYTYTRRTRGEEL